MSKKFYLVTRDLHLYSGLFISPFVLVFSVSVFFLAYSWLPGYDGASQPRTAKVAVPAGLDRLESRARVDALRSVLDQVGVKGEVGPVRHVPKEHRLVVPVSIPGREVTVDLNYESGSAKIAPRNTGLADAVVYLHKAPGPHLVAIRGNWLPSRVWRWFADGTVYLLLFISVSGIYLWAVLRAERTAGLIFLGAGAATFFGIVYALCH
jgi:hypothetical protein